MKYLKLFETTSEYEEYINGEDAILPNVSFCEDEKDVHYNPVHDYSQDYFTMVVTTGGRVIWTGKSSKCRLSYSINNGTTWSTPNVNMTLTVNAGDKILWKGNTSQTGDSTGTFSGGTGVRYSVEGNVMSLLFGDNFRGQTSLTNRTYVLSGLFNNNTNITSTKNLSLPATTLSTGCYYHMFQGCTNLTTVPELPATTLADYCYRAMFNGCTSLTTTPDLPATTLSTGCYREMFKDCTSLTTAPELPVTTLADFCYREMFKGCTNLITAPELPATTLAWECYYSMFNGCTSLTTAPELPTKTVTATDCYVMMFYGCTNLSSIRCLATYIHSDKTNSWVYGVAPSGTFTKAASMKSWTTGNDGIPSGWTVVDA